MDNNNNSKNKNTNKTINLEDKKQQKESYKSSSSSSKDKNNIGTKNIQINNDISSKTNTKEDKKIISYGISKKKKKVKSVFFKNKSPLVIILAISIVCFISYGIKNSLPSDKSTTNKFVSINPTIDTDDFNTYSTIISKSVQNLLNLPTDQKIVTETMHRNGLEVLAQGYFYWEDTNKVYFDISLKGNNTVSLLVNGTEYAK